MKGKPLLPTLRQKKRYVVYDYISEKEINSDKVYYAIIGSFKDLFGKIELAKANIKKINLIESKSYQKKAILNGKKINILKINNKSLDKLRIAILNIDQLEGIKINIYTLKTSGILKKALL
ncbi:MAG: Rpp14/Pop5 family protein [Candidatus Woesearchaeota archaeon]